MKKNMGSLDRIIRVVLGLTVVVLYYFNMVEGTLAYILLALAGIFVLTGFISFCPLYTIFGVKTSKTKK